MRVSKEHYELLKACANAVIKAYGSLTIYTFYLDCKEGKVECINPKLRTMYAITPTARSAIDRTKEGKLYLSKHIDTALIKLGKELGIF